MKNSLRVKEMKINDKRGGLTNSLKRFFSCVFLVILVFFLLFSTRSSINHKNTHNHHFICVAYPYLVTSFWGYWSHCPISSVELTYMCHMLLKLCRCVPSLVCITYAFFLKVITLAYIQSILNKEQIWSKSPPPQIDREID